MAASVMLTRSENLYQRSHIEENGASVEFPSYISSRGIDNRPKCSIHTGCPIDLKIRNNNYTRKIYTPALLPITFVLWVLESQA